MPTAEQQMIDKGVADSIKKNISDDLEDKEKQTQKAGKGEGDSKQKSTQSDPDKKQVDKNTKDTDTDTTDDGDEPTMYEAVVSKVLNEQFDGDESQLEEAKKVANVAIKTFDGDVIKAAKSYKSAVDQNLQFKQLIKKNPFIERLIQEAQEKGEIIDENYVKSLMGTATSNADQPTKQPSDTTTDQLPDDLSAQKLMKMSADELVEAGVLDKTRYQAETPAGKQEMVQQARLDYAFTVAPEKIAERAVKLTQEKQQEATKKQRIEQAKTENQRRLNANKQQVVQKYNVDFEGNPQHAQLWDQVQQKAYKIPDLDDDSDMLVAEDAVEQAVKHVFAKNNVPLEPVASPNVDNDSEEPTKRQPNLNQFNREAYERILKDTKSFKGKSSQSKQPKPDDTDDGSLDSEVQKRVNMNVQQNFRNSHLISGARSADRKKGQ